MKLYWFSHKEQPGIVAVIAANAKEHAELLFAEKISKMKSGPEDNEWTDRWGESVQSEDFKIFGATDITGQEGAVAYLIAGDEEWMLACILTSVGGDEEVGSYF